MNTKRSPKRRRQPLQNSTVEFDRLEPRAMMAAISGFNVATGVVSSETNLTAITISQSVIGQLLVNNQQVGSGGVRATTNNITKILVRSTLSFNDQVTFDLAHKFAGTSGSIPIEINLGPQVNDQLTFIRANTDDNIRVLAAGLDLDNDSVVDLINTGSKLNFLSYLGGTGNDFLFFDQAGEGFASDRIFDGQAGSDQMTFVGTSNDETIQLKFPATSSQGSLGKVSFQSLETPFSLFGQGGTDNLNLRGTPDVEQITMDTEIIAGVETAVVRRKSQGTTLEVQIRTLEKVSIDSSGGGADTIDFSAMTVTKLAQAGITRPVDFQSFVGRFTIQGTQGPDSFSLTMDDIVNGLGGDDKLENLFFLGMPVNAQILNGGSGTDTIQNTMLNGISAATFTADAATNSSEFLLKFGKPNQSPLILDALSGIEVFAIENRATFQPLNVDLSLLSLGLTQASGLTQTRLVGGGENDVLIGSGVNDFIDGGAGDDQLEGKGGDDEIRGSFGNDTILGANGNDTIFGGEGDDSIFGGPGNDVLSGEDGNDLIRGDDGDDTLLGGNCDDQ